MPDAHDPDVIRLSVPAEPDLADVVVAAVGALARRAGLSGDAVTQLRQAVAETYGTALEHGTGDLLEVTAWVRPLESFVELTRGGWTETVERSTGT